MALLAGYVRDHPRAAKGLGRAFGIEASTRTGIAELAARVRAVAFRPSDER